MALLLLLYFLQGIPIGMSTAVPMLLASRGASFSSQALFSLSSWPYSLKLLWAPVVDALWTRAAWLGPRKSWVVPVQLITGCVMVLLSTQMDALFGAGGPEGSGVGTPDVPGLTSAFFALYLLVATQDIAVDAWALTMLRVENVGYAATANAVGQSAGVITSGSLFLALDSVSVCDTLIRPALGLPPTGKGLVTMASFLSGWGCVFILVTLGLWVGKTEEEGGGGGGGGGTADAGPRGGAASYSDFGALLRLRPVLFLALTLVTGKVGWQAADRATGLVMQGRGWPKETLASLDAASSLLQLALQGTVLSRWSASARPLSVYRSMYLGRVCGCALLLACVYALPVVGGGGVESGPPTSSIAAYFLLSNAYATVASLQFMCVMAFFARVASLHPTSGGTVMTLMNTLSNLGSSLPGPLVLKFIGDATLRGCMGEGDAGGGWGLWPGVTSLPPPCSPAVGGGRSGESCASTPGASCVTLRDGYLLAVVLGMVYSLCWYAASGALVAKLESAGGEEWAVPAAGGRGAAGRGAPRQA